MQRGQRVAADPVDLLLAIVVLSWPGSYFSAQSKACIREVAPLTRVEELTQIWRLVIGRGLTRMRSSRIVHLKMGSSTLVATRLIPAPTRTLTAAAGTHAGVSTIRPIRA